MNDKIMIDTNLWIYLYGKTPDFKYRKVKQIVDENFDDIVFSTQILGEIYNVLTSKSLLTKEKAKDIIVETTTDFAVQEISAFNVLKAVDINSRYNYSYWDCLVIATALLNDCHTLYSEDMQHNQLIENKSRIINPFVKTGSHLD